MLTTIGLQEGDNYCLDIVLFRIGKKVLYLFTDEIGLKFGCILIAKYGNHGLELWAYWLLYKTLHCGYITYL